MIYVLYGKEGYLIKKEIQKIMSQHQLEEIDCDTYDASSTPLKSIVEDATIVSLFHSQKMIIVENSTFLTGTQKKTEVEQNFNELLDYLEHPNPDTYLVFCVEHEKLDERKKIVKKLKQVSSFKECNKKDVNIHTIKTLLGEYQMSQPAMALLLERTKNNLLLMEKEIEKLKLYRYDTKEIQLDDVKNYVTNQIDTDIFHFIETIVGKKKEEALTIYQEMLKNNEEPIRIIIMLANQFRLIYQAKILYQKGYTEKNISSMLCVHPYRIKLALQSGRMFQTEQLLDYLKSLAYLDSKIKHGEIEKTFALERFILEL